MKTSRKFNINKKIKSYKHFVRTLDQKLSKETTKKKKNIKKSIIWNCIL